MSISYERWMLDTGYWEGLIAFTRLVSYLVASLITQRMLFEASWPRQVYSIGSAHSRHDLLLAYSHSAFEIARGNILELPRREHSSLITHHSSLVTHPRLLTLPCSPRSSPCFFFFPAKAKNEMMTAIT